MNYTIQIRSRKLRKSDRRMWIDVNRAESKWSGQVRKVQSAWCQSVSHTALLQAHCAADQKQQLFWPKQRSVLATTPAAVRPVSSLSPFPSLAEWWRLIVRSEKAKPVRAFSSLISQVQSSSLWAGNYIWGEKEWAVATERSNRRSFQRLTTGQRLLNTAIFQPASFTLCHVTRQMHSTSW